MTVGEAQTEDSLLSASPTGSKVGSRLIAQYGCGPVQLTGTADALYERHLVFDNVMEGMEVGARERFEAVAHSVRDILSQRWIQTEKTYQRADPKRVYYLSMEFLIGRSLAKNVTNLLLDDIAKKAIKEKTGGPLLNGVGSSKENEAEAHKAPFLIVRREKFL
jgi:hypothetical protein